MCLACCIGVNDMYIIIDMVLEYGMLTWMGASQTTLRQLATVQRRALHMIGPGSFLPSLEVRRAVAALCFLYKLHYLPGPAILTRLLPPPAPLPQRETRMQLAVHHNYQLTHPQSHHSRGNVLRLVLPQRDNRHLEQLA